MGVGFAAVRTRVLPAQASAPMTSLLMKITLPATIFSSMFRPFDPSFLRDALTIFFIGLVGEYVLTINSRVMHRPLVVEEERINFDTEEESGSEG